MGLTERQAQAALDHKKSKCVTAGAGTGKTHVLVQKYISLLEEGVGAAEILALTFTEKAAGEMKIRVRRALAEKEGERWDAVCDDHLWAKVSTFHSFCASILREFSVEADVGPGFAVLDEREAARLREEAAETLIHGEPPEEDREAVIGALRAVGVYELKNYIRRLHARHDAAEAFFAALRRDEGAVLDAWQAAVERQRATATDAILDRAGSSIDTLRDLASRYPGNRDPAEAYLRAIEPHLSGENAIAALARAHRDGKFRANMGQKKNWKGDDLENLRAAYRTLEECFDEHGWALLLAVDPDDPFTRATLAFLHDLGAVYRAFIRGVEAEKWRQNALDFDDLVNKTRRLLCDHTDIAAHFRDRFRFILIDEFQDTDPVQVGIIRAILGDLTRAPANLFIVGDPKQSIYLFREADVTQFAHARDLIEQNLGGEAIPLDVNFRSTPEVVGFTNAIFGTLMAGCSKPWEFLYEPLRANRSEDAGSVEILLSPRIKDRQAGRRTEADMVARKIRMLVKRGEKPIRRDGETRPAGYGDVAILLERRTNLAYYERALERYGIPYRVHAGLGFYERQEIYDLYNILRFLANDHDDVALYGVLRSPYFGFSDARLFSIARPEKTLYECLQADLGPDAVMAVRLLSSFLSYARRLPPARLIRRIIDESGIFIVFGGMAGGEQAVANVEKLIAIARDTASPTLDGFVEDIGQSIDDGDREGDARIDVTDTDAVAIMTVHAAKGLEFPVVIVPDLAGMPRSGTDTIMIGEGLLIGVKIPNPENDYEREDTPILRLLVDEYQKMEEAEQKRLFYVAVTRARDHLILCGEAPADTPTSLSVAKTRMDWLAYCLDIFGSEAAIGGLRIPITSDPAAIAAGAKGVAPVYIPLPADTAADVLPVPLSAAEEERIYPVTGISDYIRSPAEYGQGAAGEPATRGLSIHEVFCGRDPVAVLRRYGMDTGRAEEYRKLYERFSASPLMQGIRSDHCEVPFCVQVRGITFKGTIDRLVERSDGTWALIDYKTGVSGDAGEHAVQMAIYREAAGQILRAPITPYIYFVDADRWVEVAVDEAWVFGAIERAVREIDEAFLAGCEGIGRSGNLL